MKKSLITLLILALIVVAGYFFVELNKRENILVGASFPSKEKASLSCVRASDLDKVYCFGGRFPSNNTGSNEILELDTEDLSVKKLETKLPTTLFGSSCAENSETHKIYCFGGATISPPNNPLSDRIFEFNPKDYTITQKTALLPTARSGLSCVENSQNHKIYCLGGFDGAYDKELLTNGKYGLGYYPNSFIMNSQILEYDSTLDSIRVTSALLSFGRNDFSCAENSETHKIYCFGGGYSDLLTDQIVEYNPSTDIVQVKETTLTNPQSVKSCAENTQNHRIYCFGGSLVFQGSNYSKDIFEYDTENDVGVKRNMTTPEEIAGLSCVYGNAGEIYCLGGLPKATIFRYYRGSSLSQFIENFRSKVGM